MFLEALYYVVITLLMKNCGGDVVIRSKFYSDMIRLLYKLKEIYLLYNT